MGFQQAEADERQAEEAHADTLNEGRERRICYESPVEMACIAEKLQFIAVKAVAAVGEDVKKGKGSGDGDEDQPVTGAGCHGRRSFLFGGERKHAGGVSWREGCVAARISVPWSAKRPKAGVEWPWSR